MAVYRKVLSGNINPRKLLEDLKDASPLFEGASIRGFTRSNNRLSIRNTDVTEVGRKRDGNGEVIDYADPGEIDLQFSQDLTTGQETGLDNLLAAHDPNTLTLDQIRKDKDASVLDQIGLALKKSNWDGFTSTQKTEIIRRSLQLLFRGNIFKDLDTDD